MLWTVVNERDELGSELVPDYLTSVKDGAFYGWPWSYWGRNVDTRVEPANPQMVARAIAPDYGLGAHVAPLGLVFSDVRMPPTYASGAFIGQHGSCNRKELAGYNVVFVPFTNGRPVGRPLEFLGGFLAPDGKAYGRPVGVALDSKGALLMTLATWCGGWRRRSEALRLAFPTERESACLRGWLHSSTPDVARQRISPPGRRGRAHLQRRIRPLRLLGYYGCPPLSACELHRLWARTCRYDITYTAPGACLRYLQCAAPAPSSRGVPGNL